jgi:uncharacterized protein (TIGR03546 family)
MQLYRPLFRFFESIGEESSPLQLASGVTLGFFLGLTPPFTLHWIGGWLLLLCVRVNLGAALLSYGVFALLAPNLDACFHPVGKWVLTDLPWLTNFWATITELPVLPYTEFNNTVVMGSFVVSLALFPLVFLSSLAGIQKWGARFAERFRLSRPWRLWSATGLYHWYLNGKSSR